MSSNVDYTICPECFALNAAIWEQKGLQSYQVYCTVCGHEYERGRFASDGVRLLVHTEKPHDPRSLLALTPEEIDAIMRDEYEVVYGRDDDDGPMGTGGWDDSDLKRYQDGEVHDIPF